MFASDGESRISPPNKIKSGLFSFADLINSEKTCEEATPASFEKTGILFAVYSFISSDSSSSGMIICESEINHISYSFVISGMDTYLSSQSIISPVSVPSSAAHPDKNSVTRRIINNFFILKIS